MALIVHNVALEMVTDIRPLIERIARHDRSLAQQLRRSASSVPLNIGEGAYSRGGGSSPVSKTPLVRQTKRVPHLGSLRHGATFAKTIGSVSMPCSTASARCSGASPTSELLTR